MDMESARVILFEWMVGKNEIHRMLYNVDLHSKWKGKFLRELREIMW